VRSGLNLVLATFTRTNWPAVAIYLVETEVEIDSPVQDAFLLLIRVISKGIAIDDQELHSHNSTGAL
jgi:hypothetical protein